MTRTSLGRRTKSVEQSIADTDEPDTRLRKDLTWWDLMVFGVVGGDRRGHLHHHRFDGGRHHRARDLDLLRPRRDRLRAGGPVLRRVRLDGSGRGQRLHLLLCELRRVGGVDHRLGPGPRVRRRRGDVAKSWSTYLGDGVRLRRWRDRSSARWNSTGVRCHRRDRHHVLALGTKLSSSFSAVITLIKVAVVLRGHRRRRVLHQGRQLHAVHSARGVRRRRVGSSSRCSRCSPAPAAATTAGTACWPARRSCSSRSSASTSSRPPPRRPRTRSATCPAASSDRWPSSPCSTSRWPWC